MSLRRKGARGSTVTLRARILDDLGEMTPVTSITVYIFEPDADVEDLGNAVASGAPVLFAGGVYEYEYAIAIDAELGNWTDIWVATLNSQEIEGEFFFEVTEPGSVAVLPPSQLHVNNIVDITLFSGIAALSGAELQENYEFSFLTEIYPRYTEGNKVRLEVGSALGSVSDFGLYMAILEASLEAEQLTFNKTNLNNDFYLHVKREWTTCRAAATLAINSRGNTDVRRKRLGDFSVEYDTHSLSDLLDRIASCLEKWEVQLNAGGYGTMLPQGTIKGANDPDRPNAGRGWLRYCSKPAANIRGPVQGKRRWKSGYKTRWN